MDVVDSAIKLETISSSRTNLPRKLLAGRGKLGERDGDGCGTRDVPTGERGALSGGVLSGAGDDDTFVGGSEGVGSVLI